MIFDMIRLSHSAKEKYLRCPLSYYMHYNLKLREEVMGSALPFGSAVGTAAEDLLKGKTLDESVKTFNEMWEFPEINGKKVVGHDTNLIRFSKSDQKDGLADTPWESMKIKGHMMLAAYVEDIMPTVKDVMGTEIEINIENDNGDYIIGYADAVVELVDGRRLVMDNKTSASKYPVDAVTTGDKAKQLALYYPELKDKYNLDGAGFWVSEKSIRKKEPRARTQTLIDIPTEEMIEQTLEEFDNVLYNIKMGIFPSNHPECNTFFGKCICEKYIKSDGSDLSGLVFTGKVR